LIFSKIFGPGPNNNEEVTKTNNMGEDTSKEEPDLMQDSIIGATHPNTLEDILTWLPPMVTVLADATFLLFRLTVWCHRRKW